jgi:hypothetical protein
MMTLRTKLRVYAWMAASLWQGPRRRYRPGSLGVFVLVGCAWLLFWGDALQAQDAPADVQNLAVFLILTAGLAVAWGAATHRPRRHRRR